MNRPHRPVAGSDTSRRYIGVVRSRSSRFFAIPKGSLASPVPGPPGASPPLRALYSLEFQIELDLELPLAVEAPRHPPEPQRPPQGVAMRLELRQDGADDLVHRVSGQSCRSFHRNTAGQEHATPGPGTFKGVKPKVPPFVRGTYGE